MTREQAIYEFNRELNRPYPGATTATHESTRLESAMIYAISALREPVLDENGLVPCGCGGEAHLWPDGRESRTYHVVCCECRASAHYFVNEQEAKDAWNRAMGYKEADE